MDNSLLVGKYMLKILESNEELMQALPIDKCFALCVDPNLATYPYMTFARSYIQPEYNKDFALRPRVTNNIVQLNIDIHDNTYDGSVELANLFRNALEGVGYRDEDISIDRFQLIGASETTDGEKDYCQILVFQTEIH